MISNYLKCRFSHKDVAEKCAELEQEQSSPGGLLQMQKLKTKAGKELLTWVHRRRMLSLSQMHLTACYWRSMLIILHPMAQRKMITNIACLNI